jgi:hypothetical protein
MSVIVRRHKGGYRVFIRERLPEGEMYEKTKVLRNVSKRAAKDWGQKHLAQVLRSGRHGIEKEVSTPTLDPGQARLEVS